MCIRDRLCGFLELGPVERGIRDSNTPNENVGSSFLIFDSDFFQQPIKVAPLKLPASARNFLNI